MKKMKAFVIGCLAVLLLGVAACIIPAGNGSLGIIQAEAAPYLKTGKITKAQYNSTGQSSAKGKRFKVTENYVRIRKGAGLKGTILAQLNKGQVAYIPQVKTGGFGAWTEADGHKWILVKCKKGSSYYQGWVSAKYLKNY